MKLTRDLTLKIAFVFDELIPPIIRDSKWFMYLPLKILFGKKANIFFNFKQKAPFMTEDDYIKLYKEIDSYLIKRETCINSQCVEKILKSVKGEIVLEAGCGNAYLAKLLANKYQVTGADILVDRNIINKNKNIKFVNANIEHLPFPDRSFDTVVCTHTLEHVLNIQPAIKELRRVTKKRLIVVTPCQKQYKYTFDLHIRFFPYIHSFVTEMNYDKTYKKKFVCKKVGGDIYYQEDRQ